VVGFVDLALDHLAGNLNGHAANLVLQVVHGLFALLRNIGLCSGTDGRGLVAGFVEDVLFPLLGAYGGIPQQRVALVLDALQMSLILLLKRGGLLLGGVRVGVHCINFLLAVVDHLFDRLEQKMLEHGKSDEHVAEGEQRSPWVDADKTLKACHGSSPPFVSDLLRK